MKKMIIAVAAAALASTAAYAAVTFNEVDGHGFIGKGDVKNLLGSAPASIDVQHEERAQLTQVCSKMVGGEKNRKEINRDAIKVRNVSSDVLAETRLNKQTKVTGYNLKGFTGLVEDFPTDICSSDSEGGWAPDEGAEVQILRELGGAYLTVNGQRLNY